MNCNCRAYETLSRATSTAEAGRPFRKLFSVGRLGARRRLPRRGLSHTVKNGMPAIIYAATALCVAVIV
jgi:hypothetical protein